MQIHDDFGNIRFLHFLVQLIVHRFNRVEISNEFPFEITISTTENETLRVANKIQEKLAPEEGTGIGLVNLSKLFRLLDEKEIQIYKTGGEFVVEVPLLKP